MQILKRRPNGKMNHDSQVDQGSIERGEGISEPVEEMTQQDLLKNLNQLNCEFKDFEKIREGIRTRISSIAKLVPRLNERKSLLQKDIDGKLKKVQQLERQVPVLNQQKDNLLKSIPQKQEQKALLEKQIRLEQEKVKEFTDQISMLTSEREKTEKIRQQKQDEISKIDEQIKQIKSVQEYGIDFVSTLVYASKRK